MNQNYVFLKFSRIRLRRLPVVVLSLIFTLSVLSQQQSTRKTPLMGWASWNNYSVNISENIIKNQADAMVSSGLFTAGYSYINIDDGFFKGRYNDGTLRIDSLKFPHGMKALVDYIHSKGLLGGFYSDAGANTCGSQYNSQTGGIGGGLYNHDQNDIDLFFKTWGFDFLKVDYCGGMVLKLDEKTRYTSIKTAIENTGRTGINFNVCRWQFPGTWVTTVADSWRISNDINSSWASVTGIIDQNAFLAAYASQGHYNDMDMLEVGRGMTAEEDKSHFSMWCILSSPLALGNNMGSINSQTKTILTNAEVIAINQDTTGLQGHLISDNGAGLQVWAKNLNGKLSNERAVVLFNRSGAPSTMSVKWKDLNLVGPSTARDLWLHTELGTLDSMYSAIVPSHGVVVLKIVGNQQKLQEVFEAEYGWINNFNLTQNSAIRANQGLALSDALCSGRAKAGWLGMGADNYIEFRDIYANYSGKYALSVFYLSAENRNATISINGQDTMLSNLNSGSFTTIKKITFSVNLNKGYNKIKLSNATGWLPDLDKIQLDLNKPEFVSGITNVTNSQIRVYPNPCRSFLQIDAEFPIKHMEIYSMTGNLLRRFNQSPVPVSDLHPGFYILKIALEQGTIIQQIVKE